MIAVPKLWPGSTVIILANGPSLTTVDVARCQERGRVLAIKDAIRLAPWADCLYACDRKWWQAHPETAPFPGPKYGLEAPPTRTDVHVLKNTGTHGLELAPHGLRTGKNSGYQAINLAVHLGAKTIILLGYDMKADAKGRHHWFGNHPYGSAPPPYLAFREAFPTIVAPLKAAGVEVINSSAVSDLECFPRRPLTEALASAAERLEQPA